jgi:hypothetical protein
MGQDNPPRDEGSELDAVEAVSRSPSSASAAGPGEVMCPNCGHPVEAGFKFCDWCGRPLSAEPAKPSAEPPKPTEAPKATEAPKPAEVSPPKPAEPVNPAAILADPKPAPPAVPRPPAPQPAPPAARPVPAPPPPVKPPDPRPQAPAARPVPAPPPNIPPPPRTGAAPGAARTEPVPVRTRTEERRIAMEQGPPARAVITYLVQLVAAFAAGAIVLAVVAVLVTVAGGGRVALLDVKGVPVAIAVVVAVALFAFLRTARPGGVVAWSTAVLGLLVLTAVGAYLYRPVFLHNAQVRMERALKVWNDKDASAVEDFRGDLVSWSSTVSEYQRQVAGVVNNHITANDFRNVAQPTLASLQEATVSMQTHANEAHNQKLRDALGKLAGVYTEQLNGLKLVSQGILTNDFNSLQNGDNAYKTARRRANTVFSEDVRPLLERGGFGSDTFEGALAQ